MLAIGAIGRLGHRWSDRKYQSGEREMQLGHGTHLILPQVAIAMGLPSRTTKGLLINNRSVIPDLA